KKISFFEYEEGSKLLEGDSTARRTNTATYKQAKKKRTISLVCNPPVLKMNCRFLPKKSINQMPPPCNEIHTPSWVTYNMDI
ncbi:MAG: hypothetical protein KAR45_14730, partial [Desulfobacteraceae bacterium]|nr:hypothetical protein [Desulfobacteraceae bacterium]